MGNSPSPFLRCVCLRGHFAPGGDGGSALRLSPAPAGDPGAALCAPAPPLQLPHASIGGPTPAESQGGFAQVGSGQRESVFVVRSCFRKRRWTIYETSSISGASDTSECLLSSFPAGSTFFPSYQSQESQFMRAPVRPFLGWKLKPLFTTSM